MISRIQGLKSGLIGLLALTMVTVLFAQAAFAEVVPWKGPNNTITLGLNEEDISHVEFPEEITNITLENPDYVDVYVVANRGNRAFRMRSLLPKMATRMFMTGASGNTYIVVLTTDVPYSAFVEVTDASKIDDVKAMLSKKFGEQDLIRAMAQDKELPGVLRETHLIPDWFRGNGLTFELSEVWQTPLMTGLVVHVTNERAEPNEVNLPAITIPRTDEWGILRQAAMENMRLAPRGLPNDRGVMFLVFKR